MMKNKTRIIFGEAQELTDEQMDVISNIHLRKGVELFRNNYEKTPDNLLVLPKFFKRYPKIVNRLINSYKKVGTEITIVFDGPVKMVE